MRLEELIKVINGKVVSDENYNQDLNITFAFSGDLMSDALMLVKALSEEQCNEGLLLTGLATNQSIRTAEMLDIKTVLIARDKKPSDSVVKCANNSGITLITTKHSLFTASGKLFQHGVVGYDEKK